MAKKKSARWFVYMLECERDTLYTGIALDVAARYAVHCSGKGAAYTRANKPRRVIAQLRCRDRSVALRTEAALKRLSRPQKLAWAAKPTRITFGEKTA